MPAAMRNLLAAALLASAPLAAAAQTAAIERSAPMIPVAPTVKTLIGRNEADIRKLLGQPRIARGEGSGAMWTYRRPTCALFVFFRKSGREGLRVAGVSAGPLQRGAPAPDADACLAYGSVR